MTSPFSLPDWVPPWVQLALLILASLFGLAFLAMPFSVFGIKSRLDALEAHLDELHAELRALTPRPRAPEPAPRQARDPYARDPHERDTYERDPYEPEPPPVARPIPPAPELRAPRAPGWARDEEPRRGMEAEYRREPRIR